MSGCGVPAMHYRWSYRLGRVSAARRFTPTLLAAPFRWLAIRLIKARQLGGFVKGVGSPAKLGRIRSRPISPRLTACRQFLSAAPMCWARPPPLPNTADDGAVAGTFAQDPVPAEIMRARAPAVFEWVARLSEHKAANAAPQFIDMAEDALAALRVEACDTNLVQHKYNAQAYTAGAGRYDVRVQETDYKGIYRPRAIGLVFGEFAPRMGGAGRWRSQNALAVLPPSLRHIVAGDRRRSSDYDSANDAPFNRGINVYGKGVPGFSACSIAAIQHEVDKWRRGRDSARPGTQTLNGFQDRRFQPSPAIKLTSGGHRAHATRDQPADLSD